MGHPELAISGSCIGIVSEVKMFLLSVSLLWVILVKNVQEGFLDSFGIF